VSWCFNLGFPFSCPWHPMPIPCRLLVEVTTPTIATILKIRRILVGLAPEWLPGGGFSWWALRFWRDACYVSFLHKSYPISIQDLFIRRPGRSIIGCWSVCMDFGNYDFFVCATWLYLISFFFWSIIMLPGVLNAGSWCGPRKKWDVFLTFRLEFVKLC